MSEIIKVLVLPSDSSGVGKYRSLDPHIYLNNNYSDEFFVDIVFENVESTNFKNYHIVHFHKDIVKNKSTEDQIKLIKEIQSGGTKVIMDMDDFWVLPNGHPLQKRYKQMGYAKHQMSLLKSVDYVTTTTPIFAERLKKSGIKNVIVIENSIDPEEKQFKGETKKSDKTRIGWLGGSSHGPDIQLLDGMVGRLESQFKDQYQMVLCGYDTRGNMTEQGPDGQIRKRPIKPWETSWFAYEAVFTNKFKNLDEKYREHLLLFNKDLEIDDLEKPYRRIWTKPINSYALGYAEFDISLAPLVQNEFNSMKSELKAIESGFYKKALIASDFGPYKMSLTNSWDRGGFNNHGNALLIPESKNHKLWFEHTKRLINNPSMMEDMGERLYEMVSEKYHLKTTTKKRVDFYKQLINK